MTKSELVAKKLALVETYVAELRSLARLDRIEHDIRERRFVEHSLQLAIQACLDVASHIASSENLGEPESSYELLSLLVAADWLGASTAETMQKIVGFRNVLVHGYAGVDLDVVRDVVEHRLDDLLAFVAEVRRGLE